MVDFEKAIFEILKEALDTQIFGGALPVKLPDNFIQVLLLGGKFPTDNVLEQQTCLINVYSKSEQIAKELSMATRDVLKKASGKANKLNEYNLMFLNVGGLQTNPDPDQVEYLRFSFDVEGGTRNDT